jgi:hypothetical protein
MAQHRLGKADEARLSLGRADAMMKEVFPRADKEGPGPDWADWLRFQICRREAEALLKPAGRPTSNRKAAAWSGGPGRPPFPVFTPFPAGG